MKKLVALACALIAIPTLAADNANVKVDFMKSVGQIKPVHGVGQPPVSGWIGTNMFHYLTEAGCPYSRLHDVGGAFGGNRFVDIPNLFRDFDADENDPANYDFAFTDLLVKGLVDSGVEPFFRLGVTIENSFMIKAYRIHPPKDAAKWARICEHVVRHYTEGWANGFRHKITYWEIWNEPDGGSMWTGTFDQYMDLYETASKHLKTKFPHLKIGGFASSGLFKLVQAQPRQHDEDTMRWFLDFVKEVKARRCPLDFFSFHAYDMPGAPLTYATMRVYAEFARKTLDEAGFTQTELSMNEWLPRWSQPGSDEQAARVAEILVSLQDSPIDTAMIYDARCGRGLYSPLFDPRDAKPRKAYWALVDFNELYRLKDAVKVETADGLRACAVCNSGDYGAVLIANPTAKTVPLKLDIGAGYVRWCHITDATRDHERVRVPEAMPPYSFALVMTQGGRCRVK